MAGFTDPKIEDELWSVDGNSPQTAAGVTSDTYTLASTYDLVLVHVQIKNTSGTTSTYDLRADGDTGTNYLYVDNSDTRTTSASAVSAISIAGSTGSTSFTFICSGRWATNWTGGQHPNRDNAGQAVGWTNVGIASPLDSLTILSNGSFDIEWQVYGREVGGAGLP